MAGRRAEVVVVALERLMLWRGRWVDAHPADRVERVTARGVAATGNGDEELNRLAYVPKPLRPSGAELDLRVPFGHGVSRRLRDQDLALVRERSHARGDVDRCAEPVVAAYDGGTRVHAGADVREVVL